MARTRGSSGLRTIQAIRDAGLRLIYEHGYEAMSLRQLATAAGLQPGSLYNYIATKQDLLFDLVKRHLEQLLTSLDRALADVEGPAAQMEAFVAFHLNYHMVRKREVSVVNFELRSLDPPNYVAIVALRRAYERRLTDIVEAGVAKKVFAATDPRIATFAILAMLTGVCTWYRPNGRLDREKIVTIYKKLVFEGLGTTVQTITPAQRRRPTRR